MDFFLAQQNMPFTLAAGLALAIVLLQIVSLLIGLGLSEALENLLPDTGPEAGLDSAALPDPGFDGEIDHPGIFQTFFGWLNVGRVPLMILLLVLLGSFAVSGYLLQALSAGLIGLLPSLIVGPMAFAAALPTTRSASRLLGKLVPREETFAVDPEDFVGELATVTLGPVTQAGAGKARVTDAHGNLHFVRLRATDPAATFEVGAEVLLVRLEGSVFEAITPPAVFST